MDGRIDMEQKFTSKTLKVLYLNSTSDTTMAWVFQMNKKMLIDVFEAMRFAVLNYEKLNKHRKRQQRKLNK